MKKMQTSAHPSYGFVIIVAVIVGLSSWAASTVLLKWVQQKLDGRISIVETERDAKDAVIVDHLSELKTNQQRLHHGLTENDEDAEVQQLQDQVAELQNEVKQLKQILMVER